MSMTNALPKEIEIPRGLSIEEAIALIPEDYFQTIREELANPRFQNRRHFARGTHTQGCNGPLCRKAERDYKNRKRYEDAILEMREIRPKRQSEKTAQEDYYVTIFVRYFLED